MLVNFPPSTDLYKTFIFFKNEVCTKTHHIIKYNSVIINS